MRAKINGKDCVISIRHMEISEFKEEYPELVEKSPLSRPECNPKRVTVAEVHYEGVCSIGTSFCHHNDTFSRKKGSSNSLAHALSGHISFINDKMARKEIYNVMFRQSKSPYGELDNIVKGRPELASQLAEAAKKILSGQND